MAKSHRRGSPSNGASPQSAPRSKEAGSSGTDQHTMLANDAVKEIAKEGVSGSGSELPYLDQLQASFGDYDLSGVRAHTDEKTAKSIGANAYSLGTDVVFAGSPSLSTAAEEATHSIQQASGKAPSAGVGQEGDSFEREADEVSKRVQSGKSAVDLLDRISGGDRSVAPRRSLAVQREAAPTENSVNTREVTGKAMGRLMAAQMGIEHTREVLKYGGGNQREDLEATNFNSYFRTEAMRKPEFWSGTPEAIDLAMKNPQALTAAKARYAGAGNCGEHAQVAFDYLRQNLGGDKIQQVDVSGLDHAFIMIGDMEKDAPGDLVICDPWPTKAVACLWQDHFAYTPDNSQINTRASAQNDTEDYASQIFAGLTLSPEGKAYMEQTFTDEQVAAEFKKDDDIRDNPQDRDGDGETDHNWIWEHGDTQASDARNRYRMPKGEKADSSAYTGSMMDDVKGWLARGRAAQGQN